MSICKMFVIGTWEDYAWAKAQIEKFQLTGICPVLFSWVAPIAEHQRDTSLKPMPNDHTPITLNKLAEQITNDRLPIRFQLQMHKFIWPPDKKGV